MNKTKNMLLAISIVASLFALMSWNNTTVQQATVKYEYCELQVDQTWGGGLLDKSTFEYTVSYGNNRKAETLTGGLVTNLNYLGNQGWELVDVRTIESDYWRQTFYYFKRISR